MGAPAIWVVIFFGARVAGGVGKREASGLVGRVMGAPAIWVVISFGVRVAVGAVRMCLPRRRMVRVSKIFWTSASLWEMKMMAVFPAAMRDLRAVKSSAV